MMRLCCLIIAAAAGLLVPGCVAPATITSIDDQIAAIVAPAEYEIVRFPQDDVTVERIARPAAEANLSRWAPTTVMEVEPIRPRSDTENFLAPWQKTGITPAEPTEVPAAIRNSGLSHELDHAKRSLSAYQPLLPPQPALLQDVQPQPAQPQDSQLGTLPQIKSIRDISLDITPPQLADDQQISLAMPQNFAAEALPVLAQQQPFSRSAMADSGFEWHPSVQGLTFCYQPLYFEEVNLERYGRSHGILQPFVSAAAFYSRIPAIPYMAFARPARRCTDHAHWSLPGYKIPQREPHEFVPSIHGSAAEVAAIYGIILLIP